MAKRTIQDKLYRALLVNGEKEIKRLIGCIVISRKEGGFYYLGKSGSFRFGMTRESSVLCSRLFYNELLNRETALEKVS